MHPRDPYLAGLDIVRVFALCLVTVQHALTLLDRESWTLFAGLSTGQVGVALLIAVSGLLAVESHRPPFSWLVQRLWRLFPAYWIVMVGCFLLAWVVGHKRFGTAQVVSQMLGTGLFTHPDNLVNTPTWFISLILVCYLGTFTARVVRAPMTVHVLASIALILLVGLAPKPWLLSHLLTYSVASTVAQFPRAQRRTTSLLLAGAFVVMAVLWQRAFAYTAMALVAIELVLCVRSVPRIVHTLAKFSYEYYLVHGVALFGMIRVMPSSPLAAVSCAVVLAAAAAVTLHWLVNGLGRVTRRRIEPETQRSSRSDAPAPPASGPSGDAPVGTGD